MMILHFIAMMASVPLVRPEADISLSTFCAVAASKEGGFTSKECSPFDWDMCQGTNTPWCVLKDMCTAINRHHIS